MNARNELSPAARYLLAAGIFFVCLGVRLVAIPIDAGLAFVSFYPGTAIVALLCGLAPTCLFIVLAGLAGSYIFVPPYWSFEQSTYIPVSAFFVAASTILLVTYFYQRRMAQQTEALLAETDRRLQSALALQQTQGKLDKLEAAFRQTYEQAAAGIAHVAPDGRWIQLNQKLCDILGYSQDELQAKSFLEITHPEDMAADQAYVEQLLANKGVSISFEKRYLHKDGRVVWVNLAVSLVRDEAGKPDYFICVVEDISEQKANQFALEQAKEGADAANHAKSAFLANMSHEMRTPLHQMAGLIRVVRKAPLSDKQTEAMNLLEVSQKRLFSMVDAILTLTEIDSRKFSMKREALSVEAILNEIATLLQGRAADKGLALTTAPFPQSGELLGDAEHIRMALLCYCNNAITFTPAGSVAVRVLQLEQDATTALLRFEVADTGVGIAPEVLPRLFSIFEQADNSSSRKYGGTGIGLATVEKLACLMGGEAGCESTLGAGSTFWFTARLQKSGEPARLA